MQPNNPLTDLNNRSVVVCYVYARLKRWVFNLDLKIKSPHHHHRPPKAINLGETLHGVTVLGWPANSPDLNPIENLWGIVKRKMRDTRPNNADDLKAVIKATWASIPPQQCHKLIPSMPRRIEAVIKAKGAPTQVLSTYTVNEHTFQKANNSLKMFFLLVL